MSYQQLPPSNAWDAVMIPNVLQGVLWVWNKPAHDPASVQVEIPWETCVAARNVLSIRNIVTWLNFPFQELSGWSIQGYFYKNTPETRAVFEQIIPIQVNHAMTITLHWSPYLGIANYPQPMYQPGFVMPGGQQPQMYEAGMNQMPPASLQTAEGDDSPVYSRQIFKQNDRGDVTLTEASEEEMRVHINQMTNDWNSIIQLERQLAGVRKSMDALIARLNMFNRDLNADEAAAADSLDKKDWQDARRWIRDSVTNVTRYMREYDVGITSNAGNRNRLEAIYNEYVAPKIPFPDILNVRKEFEIHRKLVQNLGIAMQTAVANASKDGENRARSMLNKIASKVRAKRNKN